MGSLGGYKSRATIGSSSATVPLLSGSSNRTSPLSSGISAWKFQLIDVTKNKEYMDGMVVKHTPGAEGASAPSPLHLHTHPSTRIATIIKELVKNKILPPFSHPPGWGGWRRAARPSPLRGISICFVTPHQGPRVRDCHLQHMSTTIVIEARLQYKKPTPPDRLSFSTKSLPGPLGPARPGRARGP